LIQKLKQYNIDTSWLSSYLNKRFPQTHYAGTISDKKGGHLCRAQWFVIGPLLFLSYVNDLPLSLTSTCAGIFAGDTTIGTSNHYVDTLAKTLTTCLQNVLSLCNSNNPKLNLCISHLDTNSRFLQIVIMI